MNKEHSWANLSRAIMTGANIIGVDLADKIGGVTPYRDSVRANLIGADLSEVNLGCANKAMTDSARLEGNEIEVVDLRGRIIDQIDISIARNCVESGRYRLVTTECITFV